MVEAKRVVRVAIAGGGIAGLTAALRLSQRGYQVTLYEEKPWLGGNLGSHADPGADVYHDVYPHMFSNFYVNFWDIVQNDLGLRRDLSEQSDFAARDSMKFITRDGGCSVMRNPASLDPQALWGDLMTGMGGTSAPDMYLYLYSMVDLIAQPFHVRGRLGQSVNGFVQSRPCATPQVASLHDAVVMLIWSIHATATSAVSYQNFYQHTFGNVTPLLWLLRGSLQEKLIGPLEAKLRSLGCTIHTEHSLHSVTLGGAGVERIELVKASYDYATHKVSRGDEPIEAEPFDHLVLAVPPGALGRLANTGHHDLTDKLPRLAHAGKRLPSEPIAVMDIYFKKKLPNIPPENVAATDSDCYFSFIDISQLWQDERMRDRTALTLAASDFWALPSDDDLVNAHHMIKELHRYLPEFDPGTQWGDEDCDIDWSMTSYHSNKDDVIFVNQVGSWDYRPEPHVPAIPNLFFAGDFCRNQVDMATAEAAVTSGLNAAAALQKAQTLGEPITVLRPPMFSAWQLGALKLMMMPSAYATKAWLSASDVAVGASGRSSPQDLGPNMAGLVQLPFAFVADGLETMGAMWQDCLPKPGP